MNNIKTYKEFLNEEINFKKAAVIGALAASSLVGCDTQDLKNRQGGKWGPTTTQQDEWNKPDHVDLPSSFEMEQVILTIGTDMNIISNNKNIGKVEERTLNWGKTFEYFDNTGKKLSTGKQKVLSLVTTIEIFDENENKIGTIEEEVMKSLFSFYSYYKIVDVNGKMIGESKKLDLFSTNIDIYSTSGELLCEMHRPAFNLISDTWNIKIHGDIDKRLVIFIPCYKTSADDKRKAEKRRKERKKRR